MFATLMNLAAAVALIATGSVILGSVWFAGTLVVRLVASK